MRDRDQLRITFRPTADPAPGVPFGVRSAGLYRVGPPWRETFPGRHFGEVFWGLDGEGAFVCGGERFVLGPGQALVVPPGVPQSLGPRGKTWEYAWFTFDGPRTAEVTGWFGLGLGLYRPGPLDRTPFENLERMVGDPAQRTQARCTALAFALLAELAPENPGTGTGGSSPLVVRALTEIRTRFGDPGFDVTRLAAGLGVHRSVLTRRFRDETGTLPSEVLKELRTSTARSLLRETRLTVAQVAQRSGFADPDYLSRVLRQTYGRTPSELRRPSPPAPP